MKLSSAWAAEARFWFQLTTHRPAKRTFPGHQLAAAPSDYTFGSTPSITSTPTSSSTPPTPTIASMWAVLLF
ncbi:hypothetical protein MA16_Dca006663 [Dendrobium catenatum]|uniref:Uncharacterized protein n=1 Tax=Dendrobium catenatum TaxID=906689 RepID=A0A2I0X5S2_9ASPA|nr:hypothetical protein MA16_Dca006663 [Dendrobium catenatum]